MKQLHNKLNDRAGATILMALLFMLVATMVSAVILSAATTAAKTLRTRRDNQQAYLTCSSAALYLRDALLEEDSGYQVSFTQRYNDETLNREDGDPQKTVTARDGEDIRKIVDALLAAYLSKEDKLGPFDDNPAQQLTAATYRLTVGDTAPVEIKLRLERDPDDTLGTDEYKKTYLLTAQCSLDATSPALCQLTLKMYCGVRQTISDNAAANTRTWTYQAVWPEKGAVVQRQGLGGAS